MSLLPSDVDVERMPLRPVGGYRGYTDDTGDDLNISGDDGMQVGIQTINVEGR